MNAVAYHIPSRAEAASMKELPRNSMEAHSRFIAAICEDWLAAGKVTRVTPRADAVIALDRELRKRGERK